MTGLWIVTYVALWLLFLTEAVVLVSVLRNLGVVYTSLAALAPHAKRAPTALKTGDLLPDITFETLEGQPVSLKEFNDHKQAVALISPTCVPCAHYLEEVVRHGGEPDPLDPSVRLGLIVSFGDRDGTKKFVENVGGLPRGVLVVLDSKREVSRHWGISTTPTTVIVDDELRVVRQVFGEGPREITGVSRDVGAFAALGGE